MDSDTSPNDQEVNPRPAIVFAFHREDRTATLAWKYVFLILKTHRLQVFVDGTILIPSQMVTDESGTPVCVLCKSLLAHSFDWSKYSLWYLECSQSNLLESVSYQKDEV